MIVKEHVPRAGGNNSAMPRTELLPRQVLAKNLQALQLALPELHPAELARRAKTDPKTLTNYLRGTKFSPNLEIVQKIASVYEVNYLDLLSPWFKPEMVKSGTPTQLLKAYSEASPENRINILRVAEMAVPHTFQKKDP